MNFRHAEPLQVPELEDYMTEHGRMYRTPSGISYPSVTTVLSHGTDHSHIDKWRQRVGAEEADRITKQATVRGSAVHLLAEQYLKNDPQYKSGHMPANISTFAQIRPYLDRHVGTVAGLEVPLYSDKLRVAGRVDCLAEWDGRWSIVDFKTSKREKRPEQIENYFMQASCYSYMVYERTSIVASQIVILIAVDDSPAQVFVQRAKQWLPKFIEIRNGVSL
jgi:hypothetical protein